MRKIIIFAFSFLMIMVFSNVISADYYVENPLSVRFRIGWGEVQIALSPEFQTMGVSLRLEENEYSAAGGIWYSAADLINHPQEGNVSFDFAGIYQIGEMLYVGGSAAVYPVNLENSRVNLIFAAGGYTRKYFRFVRGFFTRGMAAIYYQPYFKKTISLTSAYVGIFMDSWGSEGRLAADVKLDISFAAGAEGTLFDFLKAQVIFEKEYIMFGGGWNTDHGKVSGTIGLNFDAFKTWFELHYTNSNTITWAINGLISF